MPPVHIIIPTIHDIHAVLGAQSIRCKLKNVPINRIRGQGRFASINPQHFASCALAVITSNHLEKWELLNFWAEKFWKRKIEHLKRGKEQLHKSKVWLKKSKSFNISNCHFSHESSGLVGHISPNPSSTYCILPIWQADIPHPSHVVIHYIGQSKQCSMISYSQYPHQQYQTYLHQTCRSILRFCIWRSFCCCCCIWKWPWQRWS